MHRRAFLSGLIGCSAAASPLLTPVTLAQAPGEERLVVIILRGAMDGLDALRPVGDPAYAGLRPTLGRGGLDLDGFWALHDGLAPLEPLWDAGEFGAAHAVSTPYRDQRSHFDGQDILEAGSGESGLASFRDGWLNRALALMPGARAETAYAVGREDLLILAGEAPHRSWSPGTRLRLSPQARRLLEMVHHDDPLFRAASTSAIGLVDTLGDEGQGGGAGHLALAEFVAGRMREETRVASFSLGGWDTHDGQASAIGSALGRLSETVLALKGGLGPAWDRTAVLCITEFGRTARENGTGGTDHGTGGAMFLAGGAVRGGQVIGEWPGLADLLDGRDLAPTRDVRAHAGWLLAGLFGLDRGGLEGSVFPGLDLGPDPGLLR